MLRRLLPLALIPLATSALAAPPDHAAKGQKAAPVVVMVTPAPWPTAGISREAARALAVQHQWVGHQKLPPGVRKNLKRGKPLPPGIAKRAVPPVVVAGLPVYAGYEWQAVGSDLLLVEAATALIVDVLLGVFE